MTIITTINPSNFHPSYNSNHQQKSTNDNRITTPAHARTSFNRRNPVFLNVTFSWRLVHPRAFFSQPGLGRRGLALLCRVYIERAQPLSHNLDRRGSSTGKPSQPLRMILKNIPPLQDGLHLFSICNFALRHRTLCALPSALAHGVSFISLKINEFLGDSFK